MKTVTFSHHKSPSQRIDTWQPIDRKGTILSWTKPTLDQLIIRFNASKSINYATPMWNKHIYLTPNSVETNTHVSTLHSTIRKQLSKIGQSTEWHFNTQPPVGVQISLKYSTLKCTRLTSPQYPVSILGISSCHVEPDTVDPNHHRNKLTTNNMYGHDMKFLFLDLISLFLIWSAISLFHYNEYCMLQSQYWIYILSQAKIYWL